MIFIPLPLFFMDLDIGFSVGGERDPIRDALLRYRRIVFVGCSRHPEKDAHQVPRFMKQQGYEIACVNPNADAPILGAPTFKDVADVPPDLFEILVVFRPSEEVPALVDRLIDVRRIPKVFWMQEGIRSEYAREKLEPLGVLVVEDSCIMRRYMGLFVERDEVYAQILAFARNYARARGYVLNPDPEKLDELISALAYNQKKYGARYCPCRPLSGDPEEDRKKICPCFWHQEEIRRMGHCHCGLFWDPKAVEKREVRPR